MEDTDAINSSTTSAWKQPIAVDSSYSNSTRQQNFALPKTSNKHSQVRVAYKSRAEGSQVKLNPIKQYTNNALSKENDALIQYSSMLEKDINKSLNLGSIASDVYGEAKISRIESLGPSESIRADTTYLNH